MATMHISTSSALSDFASNKGKMLSRIPLLGGWLSKRNPILPEQDAAQEAAKKFLEAHRSIL